MMRSSWISSAYLALFLMLSCFSPIARPFDFPTVNLPTVEPDYDFGIGYGIFKDGSRVDVILYRVVDEIIYHCGFFCTGNCSSFIFVIFIMQRAFEDSLLPQIVWSANRDCPVGNTAILNFTETGDLVLRDADGTTVWTTNTTGKSVAGVNLTDTGNLVLFDVNNSTVWQSFDHPTDCLLHGQKLYEGQQLRSSVSSTNWSGQEGMYSLQITNKGLFAFVESNPPQVYYSYLLNGTHKNKQRSYFTFYNGSLAIFNSSIEPSEPDRVFDLGVASTHSFLKLMPDGHLKLFQLPVDWRSPTMVTDLLRDFIGECGYPLVCGRNAICSANQQCSCPISSSRKDYFKAVNNWQPNLGCSEINPLTCNSARVQDFITLKNVKYFTSTADMKMVNMETCKQACLNNCSCKAALFKYYGNISSGECYLRSELLTMMNFNPNEIHENASVLIKVQNIGSNHSSRQVVTVLASTIGSFVLVLVVSVVVIMFVVQKRKRDVQTEETYLDQVPGMPTRFSYEELKTATDNFSNKLGEGGFGSVFKGTLEDGSKIAVKCLEGLAQVKKSFLAEVESIGSIHHVNLVRLRGFCAWKSQRLLVYEFMSNGSLDQWIYHGDREHVLDWKCRKKIILDIAKGLSYLHEDCRQKIIHLDIKPQNILLDDDFNAKVSDFGLSKLIDRNQSQVMTTMRGTPGYLAPEWLSSFITEKVDVYSFGIVLLEILCGRKNFDRSQPEESWYLLGIFEKCWEQGMLLDIVDKYSDDMQAHGREVVEMMKVVSWCLQTDFKRRPSMSTIVKVLEGVMKVEPDLDYNFSRLRRHDTAIEHEEDLTPLLPSVLSGPR